MATPSGTPANPPADSLDSSFSKWTHFVARRFSKGKGKSRSSNAKDGPLPIFESAFQPSSSSAVAGTGASAAFVFGDSDDEGDEEEYAHLFDKTLDDGEHGMTEEEFREIEGSIREALEKYPPKLNASGSSGSYFVRDGEGKVRGIFKPKDEEPYGSLNPKWTKWFHRVILTRILGSQSFGRSCLIPNLSYLSESCASLLDRRLGTNVVPRTEVVAFSSPSFYYDWIDRERAKRRKKPRPLPEKVGSLQIFLKGYQDASLFLRLHPWPGRAVADTYANESHRTKRRSFFGWARFVCGRRGKDENDDGEWWTWGAEEKAGGGKEGFSWTDDLIDEFRIEMEKLVILDVMIRNTDRGLDNFMIRYCPPSPSSTTSSSSPSNGNGNRQPHIHLAAIDNSLAFPHQHPSGYRSYAYGWLWLPVSLIGQPFTSTTRKHFIPLLESKEWWSETIWQLRKRFEKDEGFDERLFNKQMAVMKGQGLSILNALRNPEHGPLELCAADRLLVHDEIVDVPASALKAASGSAPSPPGSPIKSPTPLSRSITSVLSEPRRIPSMMRSSTYAPTASGPMQISASVGSLGRNAGVEWNSMTGWQKLEWMATSPTISNATLQEEWGTNSVPDVRSGPSRWKWPGRMRRPTVGSGQEYRRIPDLETVGEEEGGPDTPSEERVLPSATSRGFHKRSKTELPRGSRLMWARDERVEEEGKEETRKAIKERVEVVTAKPYFASC
ncbi:hypothetical protein BT69DRAFT_1347504 [Atractiella rhizophila]|nr:hypothetical protein BT69DRAFT_1347504 [Atractiella rhizophila]